jgi:hypothetical protein
MRRLRKIINQWVFYIHMSDLVSQCSARVRLMPLAVIYTG